MTPSALAAFCLVRLAELHPELGSVVGEYLPQFAPVH